MIGQQRNRTSSSRDQEQEYVAPAFMKEAFTCPLCGEYAEMLWHALWYKPLPGEWKDSDGSEIEWMGSDVMEAVCRHCEGITVWDEFTEKMIWPHEDGSMPKPNPDTPVAVGRKYLEAAAISGASPRAAAVILRVALRKLVRHLVPKGTTDLAMAVEKLGLPSPLRKALLAVGVGGELIVTEKQLDGDGDARTVRAMFELINAVVDVAISQRMAFDVLGDG